MARPRSDEKKAAILAAATEAIAADGLSVPTASIAKRAGVASGSVFVYFETKAVLLNELYVQLKAEMGSVAVAGLAGDGSTREQLRHMWSQWLGWATANPQKRRALAQLEVADEVSEDSHRLVQTSQRAMAELVERARAGGPLAVAPLGFVLSLTSAMADATMDAMIREPEAAEARGDAAFEAIWRVLAGVESDA
ncbi:TetR/AcrR family transcriptional regulator [Leifsonia sp. SIMBA_070]|uniref:TetR/AcrR family transcriptional regulator n=1 Tax=Leifsonia sp. SIMBA_070 TaxID=3085810 RepID=UPI003979DCC7